MLLMACNTLEDDDYLYGLKTSGQFANSLYGIRIICGAATDLLSTFDTGDQIANR
jgi:hypothetical protein